MANWNEITLKAEEAKREMILDQEAGEALFAQLIDDHGADGMLFFKRAEAYEGLGEYTLALADYRKAASMFRLHMWKLKAWSAIDRLEPKA